MAKAKLVECPGCRQLVSNRTGRCSKCNAMLVEDSRAQEFAEPRMLGSSGSGTVRFRRHSDERNHYLVLDGREPILLELGARFVMGRDKNCSLTSRTRDVSRQHAEIRWNGDPALGQCQPVLCEVRARHGTFVNNAKINRPRPLQTRDEIRLGNSFQLVYLHVDERGLRQYLEESAADETGVFDAATVWAATEAARQKQQPARPPAPPPRSTGRQPPPLRRPPTRSVPRPRDSSGQVPRPTLQRPTPDSSTRRVPPPLPRRRRAP